MEIETKFSLDELKEFIASMVHGIIWHHDRAIGLNGKVIRYNPELEIGDRFTLENKQCQIITNSNWCFTCLDINANEVVELKHNKEMVKQGI